MAHPGLRRWFRFSLLCAALPLVMLTNLTSGSAADLFGTGYRWTDSIALNSDGLNPVNATAHCNFSAQYRLFEGGLSLGVDGQMGCKIDRPYEYDIEPGDFLEGNSTTITTVTVGGLITETNDYCEETTNMNGQDPRAGMEWSVGGLDPDCVMDNICFAGEWYLDTFGIDERWDFQECYQIDLGEHPQAADTCVYGEPVFVQLGMMENGASPGTYTHDTMMKFTLVGEEATYAGFGTVWKHWSMDIREAAGGAGSITPNLTTSGTWRQGSTSPGLTAGSQWIGQQWKTRDGFGTGNAYSENTPPLGAWIWITDGTSASPPGDIGRHHNTYTYGQTDPANCHFYFGPEFFEGQGDPAGDLNVEVPPPPGPDIDVEPPTEVPPNEEAPCTFKVTDPSTWLEGGMCAAVGVLMIIADGIGKVIAKLGDLVAAITGLAADIASAIVDFLKDALVPSDGYLDARIDRLDSAWGDTSLSKWSAEASGLTAGAASGCGGLPLDVTLPGGVEVHESLGEACSGSMASIASLVRVVLGAVAVVGGLMACVRAIGSGFGWNPGVGKVSS